MHKRTIIRLVAMLLAVVLVLPVGIRSAKAEAIQPRASLYIDSYNGYVCPVGGGKIQVWFTVIGNGYMDTLGCLRINIYESTDKVNWTCVQTNTNITNLDFISCNDYYHSGHVDYQGVAGRYYQAYICIWAGMGNDGDARYFYTLEKLAT